MASVLGLEARSAVSDRHCAPIGCRANVPDWSFFNRRLQCLIIVDLKLGKFTRADAGQMNLYLNYAREHWARRMRTRQ